MNRTKFIAASASLVAASTGVGSAQGIPGGSHLVERKADFNEAAFRKIVGRPAKIRQVFEQVSFNPAILANLKNSFNGLVFGYGYKPNEVTIALGGHGPSAAYGYSDYIWDKYKIGEFFKIKDAQGAPITSNIWLKAKAGGNANADPDDPKSIYQDTSIEALQKRGVIFLTCHTAVEEQSRNLVKEGAQAAGQSPSDVANDILTHLIPGALVVPSMVATMAVLQHEYNYTYAAVTF